MQPGCAERRFITGYDLQRRVSRASLTFVMPPGVSRVISTPRTGALEPTGYTLSMTPGTVADPCWRSFARETGGTVLPVTGTDTLPAHSRRRSTNSGPLTSSITTTRAQAAKRLVIMHSK